MVILQNATYIHPNKDVLFQDLQFTLNQQEKIALIGHNGVGKSSLLKIIGGYLPLNSGILSCDSTPYYIPQLFDEYATSTIGDTLAIGDKLKALNAISNGDASIENFDILNDDWDIEERAIEALSSWGLTEMHLDQSFNSLSGGQKVKVFLAGITLHRPELILMDEPSNHLDTKSREQLYRLILDSQASMLIVSHDRTLLNLLELTAELSPKGIQRFGGNFQDFSEQKDLEKNALDQQLQNKEKELRKAKDKEREAAERQNKLNARGKKKQEKAGVARIMMNTLRNKAEGSSAKLKSVHQEKIGGIRQELHELRLNLSDLDQMKFGFEQSATYAGKDLVDVKDINFGYAERLLWSEAVSFKIHHGDRINIQGDNGSGKSTLLRLILKDLEPSNGIIVRAPFSSIYIDQDYSIIQSIKSVYEMAESFNQSGLQEHEIKIRLNRFLFGKETWDKSCLALSGGERMRLLLCCLNIASQAPDIIILDEPTNNLDIQNIEILTAALNDFQGTLLLISHDKQFISDLRIEESIDLNKN
ncbi:ATP-binding cassette domain-containing protein [Sphingobacterium sp. DK4209]|uniref:ATP-binding cassette domain-containing protein n=1 Tax=Sphingobacterium zhuxiongii TaxID=2662364 RepID=A0A5Q0QDP8_9SPHI|nr:MULTISPECIES: ABC-F family ATP-binding cassette domain-containing protein [unclassified Sphingobacterium]MVZ65468.1 ATP-binding cassette domain-containing protein [Sphingobacterium sp. DK4209]QGA27384.1 ATP-binding cassette domain-containing protein [Sphingobacterium sp. dk4302]